MRGNPRSSYAAYGKYQIEKAMIKDFKQQTMEATGMSVFVIINEWATDEGAQASEVTGGEYYETEGGAWEDLRIIAQAHCLDLPFEETSLTLENPGKGIQFEEFYIQELTKNGN